MNSKDINASNIDSANLITTSEIEQNSLRNTENSKDEKDEFFNN